MLVLSIAATVFIICGGMILIDNLLLGHKKSKRG